MIKASALYIVIVMALVIGLLCSSLIVAAYFYKAQYQQKFRYDQLENNVNSGANILLANNDSTYANGKIFSLFGNDSDSVSLQKLAWGVYDVGISRAFIQKDTLYKTFMMANVIDSSKWAALYLRDEERPFSLSGKTTIRGDAYIPKAGVQQAYIDGMTYQGDKRLIIGKRRLSEKQLPALNANRLKQLEKYWNQSPHADSNFLKKDSVQQSFLLPARLVNFEKAAQTIKNIKIAGNIVLFSDTTVTIDSTAMLKNILVFARSILVKSGFKGNCQLFATDSIRVDSNCRFDYPSCLGILRFRAPKAASQEKITLGGKSVFNGTLFTYEKADNPAKPLIIIGKGTRVNGQIYAQGALELKDNSETDGNVFTSRFLYRTSFTLYENYLINTTIDSKALSPYYLASDLLPVTKKRKKVLQWLQGN
jgi:cytoskeletal protein CcmA (bactofilin family)